MSSKQSIALQGAVFWQDYPNDRRDGLTASLGATYTHLVSASDRLTLKFNAAHNGAKSDNLRNYEVSADAEWEHAFANGFVPSIGGSVLYRKYDGTAPLSTQSQWDFAATGRIGLSHRKIQFKNIHPELTLAATRQWSNSVFYRYTAYDAGVRLKTAF